jgi:hypothetical protein
MSNEVRCQNHRVACKLGDAFFVSRSVFRTHDTSD